MASMQVDWVKAFVASNLNDFVHSVLRRVCHETGHRI